MKLIAITGGIGSGKSVVSRLLQVMGYKVYDCDSRAKQLMATDSHVVQQIKHAFGDDIYLADGTLDRQRLAARAFTDDSALATLNGIVHPATALDLQQWAIRQDHDHARLAFVETALLRTAALDRVVDQVWHVTAPTDVRIDRVMKRSGLTAQQVQERIAAQQGEEAVASGEHVIINDNDHALMPQVLQLLN